MSDLSGMSSIDIKLRIKSLLWLIEDDQVATSPEEKRQIAAYIDGLWSELARRDSAVLRP